MTNYYFDNKLNISIDYEQIVDRLITNGANINIVDASGSKPLDIANKKGLISYTK